MVSALSTSGPFDRLVPEAHVGRWQESRLFKVASNPSLAEGKGRLVRFPHNWPTFHFEEPLTPAAGCALTSWVEPSLKKAPAAKTPAATVVLIRHSVRVLLGVTPLFFRGHVDGQLLPRNLMRTRISYMASHQVTRTPVWGVSKM